MTTPLDRIFLGISLAAVFASGAYFSWKANSVSRASRVPRAMVERSMAARRLQDDSGETIERTTWRAPTAQARGRGWIYDMFTPPEIYYDVAKAEFFVHDVSPKGGSPSNEFHDLRLIAVRHALFPLQLLGHFGGGERLLGTFEDVDTHEVFLGGPGRELAGMNLRIEAIALERRSLESAGESSVVRIVATARVRDLTTGAVATLVSGERCFSEALVAIVAVHDGAEETFFELKVGETARTLEKRFAVERIELNPSVVGFAATGADASSAQRMDLTPSVSSPVD